MAINDLFNFQIGGNIGKDYFVMVGIFVVALIVLKIFREIILNRLKKVAQRTRTDLDDVLIEIVRGVKPPFYLLISIYIAIKTLVLPVLGVKILDGLFILAMVFQIMRALQTFIDYWVNKLTNHDYGEGKPELKSSVNGIAIILKILLWIVAILLILSNWGFNVTSLVAGLGVGGIAIAFALQNILGDIFSSFSIYIDKPFQIGDFVTTGTDSGTVEKIGIKTTRIRTLQGEELVVSNRELTDARVHNYKKMEKRRIVFTLGVLYETPSEKLKMIPNMIETVIKSKELAEFDRAHFKTYGDSSLGYEIVYYINSPDYTQYMDIQQEINLEIKENFEKESIEFAYPTQTLFVKK